MFTEKNETVDLREPARRGNIACPVSVPSLPVGARSAFPWIGFLSETTRLQLLYRPRAPLQGICVFSSLFSVLT